MRSAKVLALGFFLFLVLALFIPPSSAQSPGEMCIKEHGYRVESCPKGQGNSAGFQPCYKASVAAFTVCVSKLKSKAKLPSPLNELAIEAAMNSTTKPELIPAADKLMLKAANLSSADAVIGARSVVSTLLFADAQKIASMVATDSLKEKSLREMLRAAGLIEQLSLQFRKEAQDGAIDLDRREFFEDWIGDLYNRIDHRLSFDFGVEVQKEGHTDGSVRAKLLLNQIAASVITNSAKQKTNRLIEIIKSNESYFKSLTLDRADRSTRAQWENNGK